MDFPTLFSILRKRLSDGYNAPMYCRELFAQLTEVSEEEWGTLKDPETKITKEATLRSFTKRGLSRKFAQAIVYRLAPDNLAARINERPVATRQLLSEDLSAYVPEVTADTVGKVIADMSGDNQREVILRGGKGGLGNMHFATSTMQVPKYAQPGQPGAELFVQLELKVIADVGLVGFPNVGKSTLLSVVSNAKPEIANYHFTTLNPHLGVVDLGDGAGFVMADIPGLIEGASEGVGLGHAFLKHIERTKVLVHVVDAASVEGRDPLEDIRTINKELEAYNPELLKRPQVIAANKMDAVYAEEDTEIILDELRNEFEPKGIRVFPISAVSRQGVKELLYHINDLLKTVDDAPVVFEKEFEVQYQGDRNLPYTVTRADDGAYVVEGPRIDKMLGYTNLDSEKGFDFFQKFLKNTGVLDDLEKAGIEEGDTVRMYGLEFDYYK